MPAENIRLSLCMIVRNEADMLSTCLKAAEGAVDEICILDTGSTDDTVEIARSFGARVETAEWADDFSSARNQSLEMAKGEWILVLDADEILSAGAKNGLRHVMNAPDVIAASLQFTNDYGDRSIDCLILRMFKNHPSHRFQNIIHEQVLPSILETIQSEGGAIITANVHVDHLGYRPEVREAQGKDERNLRLFERATAADPTNAYLWYKFGDFLRRDRDTARIVECLEKSLSILEAKPAEEVTRLTYCAEAAALLSLEIGHMGSWSDAVECTTHALGRYAPSAMLYWVHGQACLEVGQFVEAEEAFRTCMSYDGKATHVPARPDIMQGRSQLGIARARAGQGKSEDATRFIAAGVEKYPECAELAFAAIRLDVAEGRHSDAIRSVTEWLQGRETDGEAWALGTEVLLECGLIDDAATWGERALACVEPHMTHVALAIAGEVLLGQGGYDSAVDVWLRAPSDERCLAGLAFLCLLSGEAIPEEIDGECPRLALRISEIARRLHASPNQGPWVHSR